MWNRFTARILALLGAMLGFTSEVLAQYGAPTYFFTVKGSVKDIECDRPVKNATVKLIDRNSLETITAVTDQDGNFTILQESYGRMPDYKVRIEDGDGKENGLFKTAEGDIDARKWRSSRYNKVDTLAPDIYLVEYISGSSCKDEQVIEDPEPAKEPEPEPEIVLQDSAVLPQEDPIISPSVTQDFYTHVNLFPNPNSGQFAVEFTALEQAATDVYIYSSDGSLIYQMSEYAQKGANRFNLELSGLVSGTYYIRLHSFGNDVTKTFVVQ